jgi:serine/threonine protein kinase
MASIDPLAPLDDVFRSYPIERTNYNGTHYDGITADQVFDLAKPILRQFLHDYEISNIHLPNDTVIGSNSLVFLMHLTNRSTGKEDDIAIKIFMPMKDAKQLLSNKILEKISEQEICPKILLNQSADFGNERFLISVLITSLVTPLELYQFKSLDEVKCALVSFIDIVQKLHKLGLAHLDIKRANICVGMNGIIYLIDFDNCDMINPRNCDLTNSSQSCYPPMQMQESFIRLRMGDTSIDWFSTIYTILGYVLNMEWWKFDDGTYDMDTDTYEYKRMDERQRKTLALNRYKLYVCIQHEMKILFPTQQIRMRDLFWSKFCDIVFLIFKGHQKCTDADDFNALLYSEFILLNKLI